MKLYVEKPIDQFGAIVRHSLVEAIRVSRQKDVSPNLRSRQVVLSGMFDGVPFEVAILATDPVSREVKHD